MENFLSRVGQLQTELKAPKGQTNKFGGYKYRSCEDILEAVKPLLNKYRLVLTVGDDMLQIGERYYICATAILRDMDSNADIKNSAYARESETKKGMDDSQITGTASSYARKYALNGLFCIDDTKDADTDEYAQRTGESERPGNRTPAKGEKEIICEMCGQPIQDFFDGHDLIKAAALAKRSKEKFGKIMCLNCGRKATK